MSPEEEFAGRLAREFALVQASLTPEEAASASVNRLLSLLVPSRHGCWPRG